MHVTLTEYLEDNDHMNAADECEGTAWVNPTATLIELPVNDLARFDERGERLPSGPDDFAF